MAKHNPHTAALRHELYKQVEATVICVLNDHNVAGDTAELCASAITEQLANDWAGQTISFSADYKSRLTERDLQVYHEFTGNNHLQLARKYGITVSAVYKLLRRIKRVAQKIEGQEDLFDS